MKKILLPVFILFAFMSKAYSQDALKEAIDNFHTTLAFTYHPMADEGNFEPIKAKSHELAEKAKSIEEAYEKTKKKPKEMEPAIESLEEQCETLDKVIASGADNETIKTRLSTIHDRFHELEHAYYEAFPPK